MVYSPDHTPFASRSRPDARALKASAVSPSWACHNCRGQRYHPYCVRFYGSYHPLLIGQRHSRTSQHPSDRTDTGDLGLPWKWRIGPASRPVSDETYVAIPVTPEGAGLRPFSGRPCPTAMANNAHPRRSGLTRGGCRTWPGTAMRESAARYREYRGV
jgi:hypothetical protein